MDKTPENIIWATQQVQRLESLPGYPRTEVGIAEVAKFLVKIAREREAIEWTIDTAIAQEEKFPPPVYLREILERKFWPADRELLPGMEGYVPPPLPE